MSKPNPPAAGASKVSPARTAISLVLLLVVGVVCFIELRAGLGHMLTAKAMAAKSKDGEFENVTLEEAQELVKFGPVVKEEPGFADSSFSYSWYSLLRPLMGEQTPTITLVATNGEKPMALTFHTDGAEEKVAKPPKSDQKKSGPPAPGGGMSMRAPRDEMPAEEGTKTSERPALEEVPETPATETPAEETPAEETPAETPATEAPAEETPAETPAAEAPAEETPANP